MSAKLGRPPETAMGELNPNWQGLKFRTPEELHALQIEWRRGQQESLSEHLKEKHGTGIDSREMGWPIYEA